MKKSRLKTARETVEATVNKTNALIDMLGYSANGLYVQLTEIHRLFDLIRDVPEKDKTEFKKFEQIRIEWKDQVAKIEKDYDNARIKAAGGGIVGVGTGVAVAALAPTTAMGIATSFGIASTGTAIATLSGAAATNAALAWLGGGVIAAGGGGMIAGKALLALAGPIGWGLAGAALLGSSIIFIVKNNNQSRLENIYTLILERDIRKYETAMVELNERIFRIGKESGQLEFACRRIEGFGLDYSCMTEAQQYELGTYVNLMNASTQLLVNPIQGLLPQYTDNDYKEYMSKQPYINKQYSEKEIEVFISIANMIYRVEMDDTDKKVLWESLRKNKLFLKGIGLDQKDFKFGFIEKAYEALEMKYKLMTVIIPNIIII